jgi:hypothetical protein
MTLPPTYLLSPATLRRCRLGYVLQAVGFCLVLCVGSAVARAETCGHYLFRNGVPVSMEHAETSRNVPADGHTLASAGTQDAPKSSQTPCHGPGCRQRTIPDWPGSVPVTLSVETDPAMLTAGLQLCGGAAGGLLWPESERGSRFYPMLVFRPPAG